MGCVSAIFVHSYDNFGLKDSLIQIPVKCVMKKIDYLELHQQIKRNDYDGCKIFLAILDIGVGLFSIFMREWFLLCFLSVLILLEYWGLRIYAKYGLNFKDINLITVKCCLRGFDDVARIAYYPISAYLPDIESTERYHRVKFEVEVFNCNDYGYLNLFFYATAEKIKQIDQIVEKYPLYSNSCVFEVSFYEKVNLLVDIRLTDTDSYPEGFPDEFAKVMQWE